MEDVIPQGFNTKMRIVTALDELVGEKDYERVRVSEICERGGISRTTFYHHFEDKDAVMRWHSVIAYKAGIDEIGRTLTWAQGHMVTTQFLERYRHLYFDAGQSHEYGNVRQFFTRYRADVLRETLTQYCHVEVTSELDFQIRAATLLEAAMANERYKQKCDQDVETYSKMLAECIPHKLFELTNNVPEDRPNTALSLAIMFDAAFKI